MARWIVALVPLALVLLSGCGAASGQAAVGTAVAGTLTAQPTVVAATPTAAAPPSAAPTPTAAAPPSATPTPVAAGTMPAVPPVAPAAPSPTATAAATLTRLTATQSPLLGIQAGCVPWREAVNYDGQTQCVCGPVVDGTYAAKSQGAPTFLNLGEKNPSPNRFTIVIWGENRANFDPVPERAYTGKVVCVTGRIKVFRGVAEVEVKSPAWIEEE